MPGGVGFLIYLLPGIKTKPSIFGVPQPVPVTQYLSTT